MVSKDPPSLQDILRHRQTEEFVGRDEHLTLFKSNLEFSPADSSRRFIFSISGQGGIGKTFLLNKFRELAQAQGILCALADERQQDVPSAMARLARQFEESGHELNSFSNRYKIYLEKRKELEVDPDAPQSLASLIGRAVGKGGLHLARRIPVGGVAFEFVDDEAAANVTDNVVTYVTRKLMTPFIRF